MMKLMWCSAHTPTNEQLLELNAKFPNGDLVYLKDVDANMFNAMSNTPDNSGDLHELALAVCDFACKHEVDYLVQPGGSPAFQVALGVTKTNYATAPDLMYAHSERVSIDKHEEDGSVTKTSVFKHQKFIVM